jgi:DNA-binding transcriptional LysR family regulator
VGIDFASRVAATFLQRYPKSQLEIRLVDSMVHPVKDGFDVAFGIGPLQDSTLIARKIFTLECFLCASPDFVRNLPEPLTVPTQLNKLPFVDSDFYGGPRKLLLTNGKKRCELSPLVRARANNFQIIKQNIMQGLGIGAMPNQIICSGELQEGSIVPVLPDWNLESVDVYMIYPFQLSFSNLITAFYETAFEIITQNIEMIRNQAISSVPDPASVTWHNK